MSLFSSRRSGKGLYVSSPRPDEQSGLSPASQDTLAAIDELSRLVKNNPDLVEIYLALGNLYRAQGEIERAVHIRTSLIVRPGLDQRFKARAFFELGRDYRRGGFMERSLQAFQDAARLCGEDENILLELARLAALNNDFETASRRYGQLGNAVAQAHFMVRRARQLLEAKEDGQALKWLHKALKVFPGSVEAWLAQTMHAAKSPSRKLGTLLQNAFHEIPQNLRFVLLDGVLNQVMSLPSMRSLAQDPQILLHEHPVCNALLPLLEQEDNGRQDVLCIYYGAMLLLACQERELAQIWLEKALLLRENFWPARLELLKLGRKRHELLPEFLDQIEFFITQANSLKRFICRTCGLKREQTFFVCPRCQSWHSIGFRFSLQE